LSIDSSSNGLSEAFGMDRKEFKMFFERMIDSFAHHKIVVDTSGNPIDYIFLEVNNAFEEMTGLKKEEVIGKRVTEVLKGIEKDPADWIGRYGKVALTCEPIQFENYAQTLDRWYNVSAYCPKKGYFVSIFEDITNRKKAEQILLKNEQLLKQSQKIAHLGSWELDLKENKLTWSNEVYRIFGFKPQEFSATYEAFLAAVHPEDRSDVNAAYSDSVREGKEGYEIEHRIVRKDTGEVRFVHEKCAHTRSESGKIIKSTGMVHDITERKKAEENLRQLNETLEKRVRERTQAAVTERQRLYKVLETVPPYIVLLDKNYQVIFANKVFRDHFGESKGRPCYEFLFKLDAPCENCETYKVLKTKKPHHWEWTGPNRRNYDIYDFPFTDQDGAMHILEMGLDVTERKQAEAEVKKYQEHLEQLVLERTEALRESEQRWATTLSSIGDAVIATDIESNITFMNAVAENLTGWKLAEAHGIPIKQVFHIINQKTRREVESPVEKVLSHGVIVGLANHTLLIRKDGTEVPIDDSGAPIKCEDGTMSGVVLVFRDITERKKTEYALQRQASLIDLSPDAIIVRKVDGTITFWSKGAEKIYGWTKKQALGKNTHELLKTQFPQSFDSIISELENKHSWTGEVNHFTKDGRLLTMQSWWCAEKTDHGEVTSILESNVDVTERKKAELEITRLASFPLLNPNPVVEVTVEGEITYANPATKLIFPDLQETGLSHVFFSNWEDIKQIFANKNINTYSREVKINDHWYQQQFYRVPENQRIRVYMADIDELKQTEQARALVQEKLEENAAELEEYANQMEELATQRALQLQSAERLVAIGQTAGMVGHDIRNPLQAITSDIFLISEEAKTLSDPQAKATIMESVESINQNITYINKIVSDLQDFTKPLTPHLQDVCFSELISGTLASIFIPAEVKVSTCIRDEARQVVTDSAYMRRIITNLVINAIQAMKEHGKISIFASKENQVLTVEVEDTGEGIPEDVKGRLFTPLFTTKSKGQGLGLAVVKRLVESLGGNITFESEQGKGTKFIAAIPQTPQA